MIVCMDEQKKSLWSTFFLPLPASEMKIYIFHIIGFRLFVQLFFCCQFFGNKRFQCTLIRFICTWPSENRASLYFALMDKTVLNLHNADIRNWFDQWQKDTQNRKFIFTWAIKCCHGRKKKMMGFRAKNQLAKGLKRVNEKRQYKK